MTPKESPSELPHPPLALQQVVETVDGKQAALPVEGVVEIDVVATHLDVKHLRNFLENPVVRPTLPSVGAGPYR